MTQTTLTIIVTGASGGYGAGIAEVFAKQGMDVWIVARSEAKLRAVADRIAAHAIIGDVTSGADWDRIVETVLAASGRIDVLVNNAGAAGPIAPTVDQTDAAILSTVNLNLNSVILGCRRVAAIMARQSSGSIVNISSVCAKYSWGGWSIYSAAKAGVERFSKGLYTEVREQGVRVTTITPSWGNTEFCESSEISGHPTEDPAVRAECTHPLELGKIVADVVATPKHLEILELTVVPTVQEILPL